MLRKAGFSNITERKYAVPINTWPPGRHVQKMGSMMTTNFLTIIDVLSLPIFTEILGWSRQALESLLVDVKKEVGDPRIHSFMTLNHHPQHRRLGRQERGRKWLSGRLTMYLQISCMTFTKS
ncbi:hypothetical protein F5X99DRAFT_230062 [Biscogniauxia marginata]|nr:hypothetical protein F5X99DRAFT_230062 [Biscogniauxia marginata]